MTEDQEARLYSFGKIHWSKNTVPDTEFEDFLIDVVKTDKHIDGVLDCMFNYIDSMMWAGEWERIEKILKRVDIDKTCVTFLVGFLTSTLPGTREFKLTYRDMNFYPDVEAKVASEVGKDEVYKTLIGLGPGGK